MNKKKLIILLITLLPMASFAQQGWEVGGWLGVSHYFGDLNTRFDVLHPGPAGGAIARYNFNKRLCLRFGANYGYVGANDANSKNSFEQRRNLSFNSHIFEGAATFEFNFMPYTHGSRDEFFTPYLFGGFSVFHYNPKAKHNGEWIKLQQMGTEGQFKGEEYFLTQPALVYGLGIKWDLTPEWSMNVELNARYLFTDYLDDVSTVYPEMDDLEALRGELAVMMSDRSIPDAEGILIGQPGRQRGDDSNNDYFTFFGIGVVRYFGKLKCPSF